MRPGRGLCGAAQSAVARPSCLPRPQHTQLWLLLLWHWREESRPPLHALVNTIFRSPLQNILHTILYNNVEPSLFTLLLPLSTSTNMSYSTHTMTHIHTTRVPCAQSSTSVGSSAILRSVAPNGRRVRGVRGLEEWTGEVGGAAAAL